MMMGWFNFTLLQEELYNLQQVLQVCQHLRYLNLSGIHIHDTEIQLSLSKLLAQYASKGRSLFAWKYYYC